MCLIDEPLDDGNTSGIHKLPVELLLDIHDHLTHSRHVLALTRVNRRFHAIFTPRLYRYNARHEACRGLSSAAISGDVASVERFLEIGVDIDVMLSPYEDGPEPEWSQEWGTDRPGIFTPFQLAVARGHLALVDRLLARGANWRFWFPDWIPPVYFALKYRHEEIACRIAQRMTTAELSHLEVPLRWTHIILTPLHVAAWRGMPKFVRLCLEKGVDVDIEDFFGDSPLVCAMAQSAHELSPSLSRRVKSGLDRPKRAQQDELETIFLLVTAGADLNKSGLRAITPRTLLHWWDDERVHALLCGPWPGMSDEAKAMLMRYEAERSSNGGRVSRTKEWPKVRVRFQERCEECGPYGGGLDTLLLFKPRTALERAWVTEQLDPRNYSVPVRPRTCRASHRSGLKTCLQNLRWWLDPVALCLLVGIFELLITVLLVRRLGCMALLVGISMVILRLITCTSSPAYQQRPLTMTMFEGVLCWVWLLAAGLAFSEFNDLFLGSYLDFWEGPYEGWI